MIDIFLSYSRDDLTIARCFAEAFEREGFSVWWDQTLNPGEAFDEVTEKALNEARAVVVLWSKKSVASRWVRAEATQANESKTLVPVMIEPCKRPIMFELTHTADLSNWKGNSDDATWQSYLAGVKRVVGKGVGASLPAATSKTARPPRQFGVRTAIAIVALLAVIAGVFWLVGRSPKVAQNPAQTVAAASTSAPAEAKVVTLAVLPFVNLSSDKEQEYFSDGLTEEILNQLAQIKALRVTGRTSSFSFKGKNEDLRVIGQKLGVANLLEGSVRKEGANLRITAQLISGKDGAHLWSKTYDRELSKVFALQEEVAKDVAKALSIKLDVGDMSRAQGGTTNIEAYDAFLSARSLGRSMNLNTSSQSIEALERAVSLDSRFANAWAALALAYTGVWDDVSPLPLELAELHRRSSAALGHALELAPESLATLRAAAAVALQERNWREVERLERQMLQKSPADFDVNMLYATFLINVGRPKESFAYWQRAKNAEPLLGLPSVMLVESYGLALETVKADSESALARTLSGDPFVLDASVLLRDLGRRDRKAALKWLENDDSPLGRGLREGFTNPAVALTALRQSYADPANQGRTVPMSIVAHWAVFFGDEQLSLQALKSFGSSLNTFIIWRPDLTRVRQLPGFKDLVRDIGLVDYWRTSGNWGDFCKPVGKDDFECH